MALNINESFDVAPAADFATPGARLASDPLMTVTYRTAEKAVDLDKNTGGVHAQWRLQLGSQLNLIGVLDFTLEIDIEVLASSAGELHTGFHMRTGNGSELYQFAHYKPSGGAGSDSADYCSPAGAFTGVRPVSNYTYRPMALGGRYRFKLERLGVGNKISLYQDDLLVFDYFGCPDTTRLMPCVLVYNTIVRVHSVKFDSNSYSDVEFMPIRLTAIPANQESRSQFEPQDVAWRGSPGAVYAGPMPAVAVTTDPLCQGQDLNWVRDGSQNVLQGYIESTVTIDGEGVRRRVLCFTQDGDLVAETTSRASDGKYRFDLLWLNRRYMLVAQDDPAFGLTGA